MTRPPDLAAGRRALGCHLRGVSRRARAARSATASPACVRGLATGRPPLILLAVLVAATACRTTLPLESYTVAEVEERPTEAFFERPLDQVWEAIRATIAARGEEVALAREERGQISTTWRQAPSLLYFRRRVGGERVPLPARYRMILQVSRIGDVVRIEAVADEETNFLILSGTDPTTGEEYYQDSWRPTATRTTREAEWLQDLRERLREGVTGRTPGGGAAPPVAGAPLAGLVDSPSQRDVAAAAGLRRAAARSRPGLPGGDRGSPAIRSLPGTSSPIEHRIVSVGARRRGE